ncbi:hypothetical protein [Paludibacterium sp.]|uniref:plasmid mobilization protein n=1 Tax=Paludibacterium sp. TaxID=1917523 RepID=UPI0025FBFC88|nr:hypothetical protein [Paludibacterium sp.]MBV8648455.1 hypothetical protein [Paludibacterium sp.]
MEKDIEPKPPLHRKARPSDMYDVLKPVRPEIRMAMEAQAAAAPVSEPAIALPAVRQPPRTAKPKDSKLLRITVRFSEAEREILDRRAAQARQTPSEYARTAALGMSAAPPDPEWRKLLLSAGRELTRQQNTLDHIARQLKTKTASTEQGDTMLGIIARSLLSAHKSVRRALADGVDGP